MSLVKVCTGGGEDNLKETRVGETSARAGCPFAVKKRGKKAREEGSIMENC